MSAIFWDCNFDDMSQRYESMELPLEILLPLWYRPTSGSDQHQKLITSKKDHSLSMPAMCGRRPLPRVRQLLSYHAHIDRKTEIDRHSDKILIGL